MIKNDNGELSPVIGIILMIGITILLASIIAAFIFGVGNTFNSKYNDVITVKDIVILEDHYGIIDINDRGFYYRSLSSIEKNKTYKIEYYIKNGDRYIYSINSIDNDKNMNKFKCEIVYGVCK